MTTVPAAGREASPARPRAEAWSTRTEYCFECAEYPCAIYEHADEKDFLITHQHQKPDMEKANCIGVEAYTAEQREKTALLDRLLSDYNDGLRKTLYCLAVNLLEPEEIRAALQSVEEAPLKKAEHIFAALKGCAEKKGIVLKLRK